jgi:hypothetical protein
MSITRSSLLAKESIVNIMFYFRWQLEKQEEDDANRYAKLD